MSRRDALAFFVAFLIGGKHFRDAFNGMAALADIKIHELEASGQDVDEAIVRRLRKWKLEAT